MKILITGASGLVGQKIVTDLIKDGYTDLVYLTRNKEKFSKKFALPGKAIEWDYKNKKIDQEALRDVEGVIHLAGEPISDGRWSEDRKKRILNSREIGTKFLCESLNQYASNLKTFISTSAIGYYKANVPNDTIDESSPTGDNFLSNVCEKWEKATSVLKPEIRLVIIRTGIVLAHNGGALEKMLPPFKNYAGGKLASGKQFMSWIHLKDLSKIYRTALFDDSYKGVFNGVAPGAVSNIEFTKAMGKALKVPTLFPVPGFMLKLVFGEMSIILLSDQHIKPKKLIEKNFDFTFPGISQALQDILGDIAKGFNLFERYQWIEKDKDYVFDFFAEAKNLEKITPEFLRFKITKMSTDSIKDGTFIDYKLKIHGIPFKWKTEIKDWKPGISFVDTQLKGPYKKWIHLHQFHDIKNGCLVHDYIKYKVPMGKLGELVAGSFIKKDVSAIFQYRQDKINSLLT